MIFSFANWDFAYGHFPFHRADRVQLQKYDGEQVQELGAAGYYIEKLGPFPMVDRFAVKSPGERDITGQDLRNNQQLFARYMGIQRREIMPIPYAFSTPIAILDRRRQNYYLAMGSLTGQDNDGYFEFGIQTEPVETDLMMRIVNNRPLCDGFIQNNDNFMVYFMRVDQLAEAVESFNSIGFSSGAGTPPKIDYQLADKYYGQLFGFTNEGQYRILADQYESQCKKLIKYIGGLGI